jgi:putative alpha-1,2-mannosidase
LFDYIALGYVPADEVAHAAARTQEFAYNDFCVAQIARALGIDDQAQALAARALHYRNTYDPAVGFMRGRLRDGSWLEPFAEFAWDRRAYIEGAAWQYSWAAPHDPAGLIALMGGPEAFVAKLDRMLATPPYFDAADYDLEIHEMTEMASAGFGQYAPRTSRCIMCCTCSPPPASPRRRTTGCARCSTSCTAPIPTACPATRTMARCRPGMS